MMITSIKLPGDWKLLIIHFEHSSQFFFCGLKIHHRWKETSAVFFVRAEEANVLRLHGHLKCIGHT